MLKEICLENCRISVIFSIFILLKTEKAVKLNQLNLIFIKILILIIFTSHYIPILLIITYPNLRVQNVEEI